MANITDIKFNIVIHFSNGITLEKNVSLSKAYKLSLKENCIIPESAEIVELKGVNGTIVIPLEMTFVVPKAPNFKHVDKVSRAAGNLTPQSSPTPSGGGDVIAFTSDRSGLPQIWTINVATRQVTQLTNVVEGACQADWSPDGTQIVYTSPCTRKRPQYPGSSLYILDLQSGQVTALPPSLEGDFDPAWSPDGDWIAYTSLVNGQMRIMKIRVDDFENTVQLSNSIYDDAQPAWSADGERLAFVRIRSVGQIWLMDQDGENPVQFTLSGAIDNSDPVWYPEEDLILFSQVLGLGSPSKQVYGMRLEDIGTPEEYIILPGAVSSYIPLMDHIDISPDGDWLAFDYWYYDVLSDIYIMAFPGTNLTQLTVDPAMDYDPVWKPVH